MNSRYPLFLLADPAKQAYSVYEVNGCRYGLMLTRRTSLSMNRIKSLWKTLAAASASAGQEPFEPLANFTPRAQQVLALARKEADRFHHNFVGTEHVLLGLFKLGQGVAVNVLLKLGLDLGSVRQEVEKQVGKRFPGDRKSTRLNS